MLMLTMYAFQRLIAPLAVSVLWMMAEIFFIKAFVRKGSNTKTILRSPLMRQVVLSISDLQKIINRENRLAAQANKRLFQIYEKLNKTVGITDNLVLLFGSLTDSLTKILADASAEQIPLISMSFDEQLSQADISGSADARSQFCSDHDQGSNHAEHTVKKVSSSHFLACGFSETGACSVASMKPSFGLRQPENTSFKQDIGTSERNENPSTHTEFASFNRCSPLSQKVLSSELMEGKLEQSYVENLSKLSMPDSTKPMMTTRPIPQPLRGISSPWS